MSTGHRTAAAGWGKIPRMRFLSLDTSTESGSCALTVDDQLFVRDCPVGRSHSETLLPLINELLAGAGLALSSLDGIAFGAGPGAFTGLRVACGIAQGLAVVHELPVLPVGSLAAMAWSASANIGERVLCLLDARMGEVYWGCFERQADGVAVLTESAVCPPELLPIPAGGDWIVCGNGLSAYPELAAKLAGIARTQLPTIMPHAAAVAALAAPALARGAGIDAALALPVYVRDKVALTTAERLARGGKA